MSKIFSFLVLLALLLAGHKAEKIIGNHVDQASLDSVKWKMYSLTYGVRLQKGVKTDSFYQRQYDSSFAPVECNIKVDKTQELGDTIQYLLEFARSDTNDYYIQLNGGSYIGIGYIKSAHTYYPISGVFRFDVDLSRYPVFFQKKEQEFIEYLKHYKGFINPWLRQEALKRKIFDR